MAQPDHAAAHLYRAALAIKQGHIEAAARSFDSAARAIPGTVDIVFEAALAWQGAANYANAIDRYLQVLDLVAHAPARAGLLECLHSQGSLQPLGPGLLRHLRAALDDDRLPLQLLGGFVSQWLSLDKAWGPVLRGEPAGDLAALADNDILLKLLPRIILCDYAMEQALVAWRARFRQQTSPGEAEQSLAEALAAHDHNNEYVWPDAGAERDDDDKPWRDRIPQWTPLVDDTSRAVAAQYEQNPYPRWVVMDRTRPPQPLLRWLASRFPGHGAWPQPPPRGRWRILVAGCGTGRHAIATALCFADADVWAIDLSRRSLAYALRRAEAFGVTNVRFAQADILSLEAAHEWLPERFDVIEAVGVLHHLDEPLRGWRALRDRLAPHGLMRIGLYSRYARRGIERAQEMARQAGGTDTATIRRLRQRLLAELDPDEKSVLLASYDFYSTSGIRDLLMHVCEHVYDVDEIEAALASLELDFVGFEPGDARPIRRLRELHPEPQAQRSLRAWADVERENPYIFDGLYQFWCQAQER